MAEMSTFEIIVEAIPFGVLLFFVLIVMLGVVDEE